MVLAIGWIGLVGLDPRWFANLGFVVVLVSCVSKPLKVRPFTAIGTALLALSSFAPAPGCEGSGGAPGSSSGLSLGGYLWVTSLLLVCIVNYASAWDESIVKAHSET